MCGSINKQKGSIIKNGDALKAAHHNLKAKLRVVSEFGVTKDWTPEHPKWDETVTALATAKVERMLEFKGETLDLAKAMKGQDSYLRKIVDTLNLPSKEEAFEKEYEDVFAKYASEEEILNDISDPWAA